MALNAALGYETDLMIFMIFAHSCFLPSRWILKNNGYKKVSLPFAVTGEPLDSDIFLWNPWMHLCFKTTLKNNISKMVFHSSAIEEPLLVSQKKPFSEQFLKRAIFSQYEEHFNNLKIFFFFPL